MSVFRRHKFLTTIGLIALIVKSIAAMLYHENPDKPLGFVNQIVTNVLRYKVHIGFINMSIAAILIIFSLICITILFCMFCKDDVAMGETVPYFEEDKVATLNYNDDLIFEINDPYVYSDLTPTPTGPIKKEFRNYTKEAEYKIDKFRKSKFMAEIYNKISTLIPYISEIHISADVVTISYGRHELDDVNTIRYHDVGIGYGDLSDSDQIAFLKALGNTIYANNNLAFTYKPSCHIPNLYSNDYYYSYRLVNPNPYIRKNHRAI